MREGIERFVFKWTDKSFRISVSIGVAIVDPEDASINRLLSAADQACYAAKEQGRNRVKIFAPSDLEMQQRSTEMHWVERIHDAIATDRFELFYQPILSLDNPEQGLSRPAMRSSSACASPRGNGSTPAISSPPPSATG
jgi:predicted signal transduction protein with EAL and GGDEF domain